MQIFATQAKPSDSAHYAYNASHGLYAYAYYAYYACAHKVV